MDALLASAGPLPAKPTKPSTTTGGKRRRALPHQTVTRGQGKDTIDSSLHSILPQTRLPASLHSHLSAADEKVKPDPALARIKDKKLRAKLASEQVAVNRAKGERDDVQLYLNNPNVGSYSHHSFGDDAQEDTADEPMDTGLEVDVKAGERTWRVSQDEIRDAVGLQAAGKKFDLVLDTVAGAGAGGYSIDYTRNGRYVRAPGFCFRVYFPLLKTEPSAPPARADI
jgi:U3 small nucleolar RNA-associated protein 7